MTRLTTCFASAALLIVLGSTAHAQHRLMAPNPHGSGHAPTPRLGFNGQISYGHGMRVNYVQYGTPAHWIGLERGDVIVRINGRRINSRYDYDRALEDAAYYRGGRVVLVVDDVRAHGPFSSGPHFKTVVGQLTGGFGRSGHHLAARPMWP